MADFLEIADVDMVLVINDKQLNDYIAGDLRRLMSGWEYELDCFIGDTLKIIDGTCITIPECSTLNKKLQLPDYKHIYAVSKRTYHYLNFRITNFHESAINARFHDIFNSCLELDELDFANEPLCEIVDCFNDLLESITDLENELCLFCGNMIKIYGAGDDFSFESNCQIHSIGNDNTIKQYLANDFKIIIYEWIDELDAFQQTMNDIIRREDGKISLKEYRSKNLSLQLPNYNTMQTALKRVWHLINYGMQEIEESTINDAMDDVFENIALVNGLDLDAISLFGVRKHFIDLREKIDFLANELKIFFI